MRVLVVEDEEVMAEVVALGLRREGMAVDVAHDGEGALDKALVNDYDVVVLDRDLPLVHGDDVCRTLVDQGRTARILMLTASGAVEERVEGLSIGADDYLPKPFAFPELVARVRTLARRAPATPPVLRAADVEVDPGRRRATRGGRELNLAPKEFAVLEVLLGAGGRTVSAEELLERAWDEFADPFTNTVRVTVMKLRRKLGEPQVIETLPGAGYRITP